MKKLIACFLSLAVAGPVMAQSPYGSQWGYRTQQGYNQGYQSNPMPEPAVHGNRTAYEQMMQQIQPNKKPVENPYAKKRRVEEERAAQTPQYQRPMQMYGNYNQQMQNMPPEAPTRSANALAYEQLMQGGEPVANTAAAAPIEEDESLTEDSPQFFRGQVFQ